MYISKLFILVLFLSPFSFVSEKSINCNDPIPEGCVTTIEGPTDPANNCYCFQCTKSDGTVTYYCINSKAILDNPSTKEQHLYLLSKSLGLSIEDVEKQLRSTQ